MHSRQARSARIHKTISFTLLCACVLVVCGCSSSGESEKAALQPTTATRIMQQEMARLRHDNDSLRMLADKLQQDNRAMAAHTAELEAQLADLREKAKSTPPPQPAYVPTPTPTPTPRITDPNLAYQEGLRQFRARNYNEAETNFQSILDGGAGSLEDHCHYWIGECEFAQKNYQAAIDHFQKVFSYERSSKKDDAQMMIGNSYYAMGNKAKAKEEYEKLIEKFPASPYVKSAKGKLSKIKG